MTTSPTRTAVVLEPRVRTDLYGPVAAFYYAFKEGPMLREALGVVADKARHETDRWMAQAAIFPLGKYERKLADIYAQQYREVRRAAIALIDHLDGHEGFDDARDQLEAALEAI